MSVYIQVVQHLKPGGIETMALDLCRMREQGEQAFVVSLEGTKEQALQRWPKLAPYSSQLLFLNKKPGWQFDTLKRLIELIRFFKVTSVHTHHIGPLLYGGLAARLSGIKTLIHTEHDAWHLQNAKRCLLQRWALKLVRPTLVADAALVAKDMSRHLGLAASAIHVIKNGINTGLFEPGSKDSARAKLQLPNGVKIIGSAGRLEPEKGHSVLIHAMTNLAVDTHLAIAGNGSQINILKALCQQLQISDRVHFLGNVEQMPCFYQALDLFCLPSYNEGLSLVLLEAQSCDVPAVVTNVGASHEALCPNSGRLVSPGEPEELAASLSAALQHPCKVSPRPFIQAEGNGQVMAKRYACLRGSLAIAV